MEPDLKSIEAAIANGLPVEAHWTIEGTSLDFDFSIARRGFRSLPEETIEPSDAAEADLLIFGEQDFAKGGGAHPWLCVRKSDGSVYGFDLDEAKPMFLLNTSIEQFVATFRILNEHLGTNQRLPSGCERELRAIDPDAYPKSEWRLLVEHLRSA